MGKKKNKSFYKANVKPVISDNKILLAALGGVAAGITLAGILGTEKAKQIVQTVEDSVKDFTQKFGSESGSENTFDTDLKPRKKHHLEKQPI
jgi:hypothetical protein